MYISFDSVDIDLVVPGIRKFSTVELYQQYYNLNIYVLSIILSTIYL